MISAVKKISVGVKRNANVRKKKETVIVNAIEKMKEIAPVIVSGKVEEIVIATVNAIKAEIVKLDHLPNLYQGRSGTDVAKGQG